MARFITYAVNGRGNTVMIGGRNPSGPARVNGWNAGVRVVPIGHKGERDAFEIYMTGGSHDAGKHVLLGEVRDTPEGPLFFPSAGNMTNGKIFRFDGTN